MDYWTNLTSSRLTRRRALATTGAGALGAAFLAACGGSDSGSGGGNSGGGDKGGSSTVTKPEDTLKEAKRGGTIKDRTFGDVSTQDPFTPNNTLNAIEGQVYS